VPRRSAILIQPRLLGPREAGGYSVVRIISACYIALFYASLDNQTHPLTGTVAVKRTRAKHCRPARFATGHGQPAKECTRQAETVLVRHDAKAIVFAQPLGARKGLVGSLTPALT